jgi:hypothetical protein
LALPHRRVYICRMRTICLPTLSASHLPRRRPAHCRFCVLVENFKLLPLSSMDFEALKGLLWRVAEEVEAEIKQVEKELTAARRVGAETRAEELSAIRDILYEDRWFRIATAVFTQLKKEFAEDGKAAEVIEAAERRLYGLRLEVIEVPLLKIEAAVDRDGRVAAVRCRAALDVGVEAVYVGAAPGYRLEERAQTGKTTGAGAEAVEETATGAEAVVERRDEVERLLEEVRREFSGLPVYVGVEGGYVYVKRTAPMDQRQFKKYTEVCKRLGFRFDRRGERWVKPLEELKTT